VVERTSLVFSFSIGYGFLGLFNRRGRRGRRAR